MIIYFISIITFLLLLYTFKLFSYKLNLIDRPNFRKRHVGEIPLIGGLIIYFNIFIFSFFYEIHYHINTILFTSSILIVLGAIDDSKEIGVIFRLIAQLTCCLIIIGSGLVIINIGDYMFLPQIKIGILSVVFTVFCVMGLTNAFNFIDGIDGLCSSLVLVSIITILSLTYFNNTHTLFLEFEYLILVCLSIFLFIIFNITNFNKIFLGDSGSVFLGFLVSWLLIFTSQHEIQFIHPVLTIWCVSLPVCDIFSVIVRRLIKKQNPFKPDRRHIHHILLELGFSKINTFIIILILCILLNIFGCFIFYLFGPAPAMLSFIILLLFYIFIMIYLSKKTKSI